VSTYSLAREPDFPRLLRPEPPTLHTVNTMALGSLTKLKHLIETECLLTEAVE
jgi:hypothetical protein